MFETHRCQPARDEANLHFGERDGDTRQTPSFVFLAGLAALASAVGVAWQARDWGVRVSERDHTAASQQELLELSLRLGAALCYWIATESVKWA